MQKKESIQSRIEDVLVVLICLVGIGISLRAFITELNAVLVKLNESPVATITFKYRTAQRRTLDRILWDRLRQESPVYNGDTIRTAERSEATLHFSDGSSVGLTENTMIQVYVLKEGEARISLEDGTVLVSSTGASRPLAVSSGGNALSLAPGASVAASGGDGGLSLRVLDGTVADSSGNMLERGMNARVTGSTITAESLSFVASPAPHARYLQHERGPYVVPFRLNHQAASRDSGQLSLILSPSRTFGPDAVRVTVTSPSGVDVPLDPGSWYWRLQGEAGTLEEGNFKICDAPDPTAIAPAENYEYRFRSRRPPVRFIWTENEYASFWLLTVADNPGMNNPVIEQRCSRPSSIVSSLGEGVWYWRVTPWYPVNDIGYAGATDPRRFTVLRKEALSIPELLAPGRDGLVSIGGKGRSVLFSWKSNTDAEAACITIADNEALSSPLVSETVRGNVFSLSTASIPLRNGRWHWSVRYIDQEGTESLPASTRQFVAMEVATEQRLLYPPDGYAMAQSLVADSPFTWKTNSTEDTRFQISASSDFSAPIVDAVQNGRSAMCPHLETGTWYWRVATVAEGVEITSNSRRFSVVGPLARPVPVSPEANARIAARSGQSVTFRWEPVTGATSYTFSLYRQQGDAAPLVERSLLEKTETDLSLEAIPDGPWIWTVQAFAGETAYSTRRNGAVSRSAVTIRHINPIVLLSPADGTEVEGLAALLDPPSVTWQSAEKPARTRLVLAKDRRALDVLARDPDAALSGRHVILANPDSVAALPPLDGGAWWWTVAGSTRDGLSLTPSQPRSLRVREIPRLSAPVLLEPASGTRYGPEFLASRASFSFSWRPVEGATHYRLEIRDAAGHTIHSVEAIESTAYVLSDKAVLDGGDFRWTVEALRLGKDGAPIQNGNPAEAGFSLNLPAVVAPRSRTRRTLYGN